MANEIVFRPRANLVWGASAIVLDALYLVQVVFYPTKDDRIALAVVLGLALALGAYAIWLRPKLVLGDDGLIVVNPLSTKAISYGDITDLETKWALLIRHSGGATRVWVAPTNGRTRWAADNLFRWGFNKIPRSDRAVGAATAASESINSDSGLAAELIRQRLKKIH
jgi:hypothetical protein